MSATRVIDHSSARTSFDCVVYALDGARIAGAHPRAVAAQRAGSGGRGSAARRAAPAARERRALVDEREVSLTGAEFQLLLALAQRAGELVDKATLTRLALGREQIGRAHV